MSLRFKLGELAIYRVSMGGKSDQFAGQPCEIIATGPRADKTGQLRDYIVEFSGNWMLSADDHQLRKIDPPSEPVSMTRTSDEEAIA